MNPLMANPPVFGELDLSYPMQSPYVSQQAYELYSSHLALDNLSSQTLPTNGHSSVSHSVHPSPALHIHEPHDVESFNGTQTMPAIPMSPPTKPRKRKSKAPTLRADA